jgi:hypothetical protein
MCIGDEIISVNGKSVKGRTKVEVAKLIQACKVNISFHFSFNFIRFVQAEVTIHYNKLHAQPKEGKTLDIGL